MSMIEMLAQTDCEDIEDCGTTEDCRRCHGKGFTVKADERGFLTEKECSWCGGIGIVELKRRDVA